MRDTIRCLLLLCVLLMAVPGAGQEEEKPDNRSIRWDEYRAAEERSRSEGKPLLIHFETRWDKWCTQMELNTFRDRFVIRYLNENFVMTRVDTEKVPALARKFDVESWPTLWFLDSGGRRLTHVPGYLSPENLLPLLEFIHTKAYEESTWDDWRKRRS